ncbi:uncharacterized protein [Apostichopus japonicus]|uniref:uncharacterized protein n=1 Tax=Stichopus japonicus TaxID=307972 RepID=UPI003AB542A8
MAYSYQSMLVRLYLAAMHYNENAGRSQRKKKDGTLRWSISFPRGKDGDYVLHKLLEEPTFEYVHELMEEAVQLVQRGGKTLRQTIPILSNVPPPLAASLENTPSCKLLLEGKLPDLPI